MNPDLNRQLALLKQRYEELDRLVGIADLCKSEWHALPSRNRIETLLIELHRDAEVLERILRDAIIDENVLISQIGKSHAEWYRNVFLPNLDLINRAFHESDPLLSNFFDRVDEEVGLRYKNEEVANTFYAGLEQLQFIVDNNPDMVESFALDDAWRVIGSEFLDFNPDAWIVRTRYLQPVLIDVQEEQIPAHVRFRLRELYRTFILGNWFSVFALSRTILEYSIINLASRYELDPFTTSREGKKETKRLGKLVSEMAERLPNLRNDMETVTEYGNRFLHPNKRDKVITYPKIMMETAEDSIKRIKHVVEEMYSIERPKK